MLTPVEASATRPPPQLGRRASTFVNGRKRRRKRLAWRRGPLRNRVEYIALRSLGLLLRLLPVQAASSFMGWCWRTIAPRLHRQPRVLKQLTLAFPEKSPEEIERIASAMWDNLGRVFAESFMVDRMLAAGLVETRTGPITEYLRSEGKGVVFVSLHSGNFELAITATVAAGIKAAGVYQRVKNPLIDRYLVQSRRDRYPRGLFEKGAQVARKLMRIVREGGAVSLMADLRDRRGIKVPFFGQPAPSTTFPALICRTSDAVLVAARVIRTKGARFIIEGKVVEVPRTQDREADVEEATRRLQALFEEWIREYPEQWMWAHRRWG
jgi:KDO2-lipid IV(A) lauroyltransferase